MGCGIHFYVEYYKKGKWHSAKCPKFLIPSWYYGSYPRGKWHVSRDYILFGILAGVRFHQLPTPIAPRDLPSDVSPIINTSYGKWAGDAHTPSYILLSELLDFEKIIVENDLYLNARQYKQFKENKLEPFVFFDREPNTNDIISLEELDRIINLLVFSNDDSDNVKKAKVFCKFPLNYFMSNFYQNYVPEMKKLNKDASKVRCVFWFDN